MSDFWFPARVIVSVSFPHINAPSDGCAHDILEIAFILYESCDSWSQRWQ